MNNRNITNSKLSSIRTIFQSATRSGKDLERGNPFEHNLKVRSAEEAYHTATAMPRI